VPSTERTRFILVGNSPVTSGCLLQHANYVGRTTPLPTDFWQYLAGQGLGNLFPISELPDKSEGSLGELGKDSHFRAFEKVIAEISRNCFRNTRSL
jgi:hypothetical protein